MFLVEFKYIVKEKRMPKYITDNLEISSDEENSEEENSNEKLYWKISDEEIYVEEYTKHCDRVFFERGVLRMSFFREQFRECFF